MLFSKKTVVQPQGSVLGFPDYGKLTRMLEGKETVRFALSGEAQSPVMYRVLEWGLMSTRNGRQQCWCIVTPDNLSGSGPVAARAIFVDASATGGDAKYV